MKDILDYYSKIIDASLKNMTFLYDVNAIPYYDVSTIDDILNELSKNVKQINIIVTISSRSNSMVLEEKDNNNIPNISIISIDNNVFHVYEKK